MFELTSGVRARRGPVHVFNPQGVGDVPSTFRWNPLEGCQDPATAIRRADAFANSVSQKGVEDATFWASKASDYLRAYFHAAAADGPGPAPRRPLGHRRRQRPRPRTSSTASPGPGTQWAAQLAELRGEANKTAQTIRMTMSRALAFLADPALAASVLPDPGQSLDLGDVPAPGRDLVPDRRDPRRGLTRRPAVRLPGQRDSTTPPRWPAAGCPAGGSTRRC